MAGKYRRLGLVEMRCEQCGVVEHVTPEQLFFVVPLCEVDDPLYDGGKVLCSAECCEAFVVGTGTDPLDWMARSGDMPILLDCQRRPKG